MRSSSVLFTLVVALVGCGSKYAQEAAHLSDTSSEGTSSAEPGTELADDVSASDVQRKIIYTATIDLIVKDFPETEQVIAQLVSAKGGYIAEFREDRRYGGQLSGHWVVRIPVNEFEAFIDQVVDLGVPQTRQIDAQDVTEQYIDLTARLDNKKRLEQRILDLLENETGEIKDVIEVESQLGRVREEIEVFEGKLRYLTNRIDMTTITISAWEDKSYTPAQAPTFPEKMKNALVRSLNALRSFAEAVILFAIGSLPWLALALLVFGPAFFWLRSRRR